MRNRYGAGSVFLFVVFFLALSLFSPLHLFSDDRTDNLDLFVVLDKSLSMENTIDSVKEYVKSSLVDEVLIPGDFFVLIQFYGKAEILIAEEFTGTDRKTEMTGTISNIRADGSFTDIGNALDTLRNALDTYRNRENREYLLLVTDGKQEAPPDSKYYSPDGSFNHAFLENAKEIEKEGWSVHILGIGADSEAEELADRLAGTYTETSEEPTPEEIEEKTADLFGTVTLQGPVSVSPVDKNGGAEIGFSLVSEGFSEQKNITVSSIIFSSGHPGLKNSEVAGSRDLTIPAEGEKLFTIPIELPPDAAPGKAEGDLVFTFSGGIRFSPSSVPATFVIKGFVGRNIWIIPVVIVVIAALAFAIIFLLRRGGKTKSCSFRLYENKKPVQSSPFTLDEGDSLHIMQSGIGIEASAEKGDKLLFSVTLREGVLTVSETDESRCSFEGEKPEDILNRNITLKLKSGIRKEIGFKSV